jgi:hypothetical protein
MHFKQPQIIYTNRWRSLQCSGGGDERRRRRDGRRGDETRDERLWRVAAKAGRRAVGDKMKWETLNLNDLRCII